MAPSVVTPQFPLPEHLRPRVVLTQEQQADLRKFALLKAKDCLIDHETWGRTNVLAAKERGWKLLTRKDHECCLIKKEKGDENNGSNIIFRNNLLRKVNPTVEIAQSLTSGTYHVPFTQTNTCGLHFMGYNATFSNMQSVASTFQTDTDTDIQQTMAHCYSDAYLDSCILASLESSTVEDPYWYLGLKWLALRMPYRGLASNREFVYLEHRGSHLNSRGERKLYRVIQSINVSEFGGAESYFGLTRGYVDFSTVLWMNNATSFQPSPMDIGVLNISFKGFFNPKGKSPLSVIEPVVSKTVEWFNLALTFQRLYKKHHDEDERSQISPVEISRSYSHDCLVQSNRYDMQLYSLAPRVIEEDLTQSQSMCSVCLKKFQRIRRIRHLCAKCSRVACGKCVRSIACSNDFHQYRINTGYSNNPLKALVSRMTVCIVCIDKQYQKNLNGYDVQPNSSVPSSLQGHSGSNAPPAGDRVYSPTVSDRNSAALSIPMLKGELEDDDTAYLPPPDHYNYNVDCLNYENDDAEENDDDELEIRDGKIYRVRRHQLNNIDSKYSKSSVAKTDDMFRFLDISNDKESCQKLLVASAKYAKPLSTTVLTRSKSDPRLPLDATELNAQSIHKSQRTIVPEKRTVPRMKTICNSEDEVAERIRMLSRRVDAKNVVGRTKPSPSITSTISSSPVNRSISGSEASYSCNSSLVLSDTDTAFRPSFTKVKNSIANQAYLLHCIQRERERLASVSNSTEQR